MTMLFYILVCLRDTINSTSVYLFEAKLLLNAAHLLIQHVCPLCFVEFLIY
jgi:hypothetical protein